MSEQITIEEKDIENIKDFNIIKDCILCPLCKNIYIEPVQCSQCQECYCKNCISNFQKYYNKICKNECTKGIIVESKVMLRILNIIKLKCNLCNNVVPYNKYKTHLLYLCPLKNEPSFLKNKVEELENKVKSINKAINDLSFKHGYGQEVKEDKNIFRSANHKHILIYVEFTKPVWSCSLCQKEHKKGKGNYYCSYCDYSLCEDCVKKERKAAANK